MIVSQTQKIISVDESANTLAISSSGVQGLSAYQVAVIDGFVGTQAEWSASLYGIGGTGSGDMLKSTYDTNNSGVVDAAETVPWAGVSGKPTVYTPDMHTHSEYLPLDVLTSLETQKSLSANQGRILKGTIDNLVTLINSNDLTLDTLQEIVDFIKLNKSTLDALGIGSIAGLQNALDGKVDDGQVLTNVPSGALFTDTVYSHPAEHPISMITGLQSALGGLYRYISGNTYWCNGASNNGVAPSVGTYKFSVLEIHKEIPISALSAMVGAASTALCRLAIYAMNTNGTAGNVIVQTGEINLALIAGYTKFNVAINPIVLPAGLYWVASTFSAATGTIYSTANNGVNEIANLIGENYAVVPSRFRDTSRIPISFQNYGAFINSPPLASITGTAPVVGVICQ